LRCLSPKIKNMQDALSQLNFLDRLKEI